MGKHHPNRGKLDTQPPPSASLELRRIQALMGQLKSSGASRDDLLKLKSVQEISGALNLADAGTTASSSSNAAIKSRHSKSSTLKLPVELSSKVNYAYAYHLLRSNLSHFFSWCSNYFSFKKISRSNLLCLFFTFLAACFYLELHTLKGFTKVWFYGYEQAELKSVQCTVEHSHFVMEVFRPPVPCGFCQGLEEADRVGNITSAEFESKYAYSGVPVIITDAMSNWSAPNSFSFNFFKSIYGEGSRSLEHEGENCLFFPYRTEFRSLGQVFNMSEKRYSEPWYIGWSNCDPEASHVLRQHYNRPYFLPESAESTHADWIFMGTPGYGAHMHIDHVYLPSWQAQISGSKRWYLQPPPECYFQCQPLTINVAPGEIRQPNIIEAPYGFLVILDTNKWYHQTLILPGQMSITIGSEYD